MRAVVCDCSVSAAWCLRDETNEAADHVLAAIEGAEILVPAIWPAEMANVLRAAERRDRISAADADAALATLRRMPVRIDAPSEESTHRLLVVARDHELSAYDAAYLELAIRAGTLLATLDRRLTVAAGDARVDLVSGTASP